MLRILIEKEIRDLIGSTKFVYTFAVCAVLILIAFYIGAAGHRQNVERWEASRAENIRQMEGLTDWLRLEHHRIFLPPQPLASLVSGVSNDIGRTTEVEARGELLATDSQYNEEPVFAIFRFLDLEFIFQIILSLFAILLGYDAISGEKERGTLKLCMANAVSRPIYLLGKFIGSYVVLTVSLLLAIGVGCLILPIVGVFLTGEEWLRLVMIILTGLIFFGAFLSLALFTSSFTQRSANSFLLLLVFWVGSILILPRVAVLTAGRAVDVPTVDEVGYQKAGFSRELWKEHRKAMTEFRAPEGLEPEEMFSFFNQYMDSLTAIRDDRMNEYRGRLNEQRYNAAQQREKVAFGLARISPSAALELATSEFAMTSSELKNRFYDQAMNYQPIYADFLHEKTGINVGGKMFVMRQVEGEEPEPIDPSELPDFKFTNPAFSESLSTALPNMGLLGMFNLLFFLGAIVTFNRYDVR